MNKLPEWANWVARDKSGDLWVYDNKPEKVWEDWLYFIGGDYEWINDSEGMFNHVKWTDEEPTRITHELNSPTLSNDLVNKPNHYIGVDGLEVETVLQNFLPKIDDPYVAHRVASAIEYLLRAAKKNGRQDYQKAGRNIQQIEAYYQKREPSTAIDTYYGGTNLND